jgi:hypothetical protein
MNCKIVIPSHKRHDNVITTKLVNNPIICVEQSQYEIYREYNPDYEIVAHPDNIVGLIPKRNWMLDHFGDMFMMDDDLMYFNKLYIELGEVSRIKNKELVNLKIQQLYELAKLTGINLFGFTKNPRPEQLNVFKPYSLSHSITGCAYGVIKSENIKWDESFKLKEDYLISCYVKYTERKILIDRKYNFAQKDTFKSSGGLAHIRNNDEELRNILRLKKYFGNVISLKKTRKSASLKKEYDVTIKFPY